MLYFPIYIDNDYLKKTFNSFLRLSERIIYFGTEKRHDVNSKIIVSNKLIVNNRFCETFGRATKKENKSFTNRSMLSLSTLIRRSRIILNVLSTYRYILCTIDRSAIFNNNTRVKCDDNLEIFWLWNSSCAYNILASL